MENIENFQNYEVSRLVFKCVVKSGYFEVDYFYYVLQYYYRICVSIVFILIMIFLGYVLDSYFYLIGFIFFCWDNKNIKNIIYIILRF